MHDLISKCLGQCDLILDGKDCDVRGPALCPLRLGKQEDCLVPAVQKDTTPPALGRRRGAESTEALCGSDESLRAHPGCEASYLFMFVC